MRISLWTLGLLPWAMTALGGTAPTVVSSSTVRVELNARGEVSRIVTRNGVEMGGTGTCPIFDFECTRANDFTVTKWMGAGQAKSVEAQAVADGVDVVYTAFPAELPVERAVCRIRGEQGGKRVRFGLSAEMREGWALTTVRYPQLLFTRCIGANPEDDAFVTGDVFSGGANVGKCVMRHPADPARKSWRVDLNFPGALTVQFAEFYDAASGLVFAAEDSEGAPKQLTLARRDNGFFSSWATCVWEPGVSTRPFDVTLAAFEGTADDPATWHDGADIYREWTERQRWGTRKLAAREDAPSWLRTVPALTMFTRPWFDNPEQIRAWLRDYRAKRHPGVPMIAALWGWEKHDTWIGFDYFPCHPSDAVFTSLMDEMRAADVHPYPWPSGYFWTLTYDRSPRGDFSYDDTAAFERLGAAHAVVDRNGSVHRYRNYWLKGGEAAELCGGDPWTIPWVTEKVGRELASRGCELIQGDQLNGGAFRDCWSRSHGHPPGRGVWKAQAARRQLEAMRQMLRAMHPEGGVVTYEEANETLNDLCGIQLVRSPRAKEPVEKANVYTYLHHGNLPLFGAYPARSDLDWAAYSVVQGLMPRFIPDFGDLGGLALPPTFFASVQEVASTGTNRFHHGENVNASDGAFVPGRRFRLSADLEALGCASGASLALDFGVYTRALKPLHSEHVGFPAVGEGVRRISRDFTMPEGAADILRVMVNVRGEAKGRLGNFRLEEVLLDGSVREVHYRGDPLYEQFMSRWVELYRGEGRPFLAQGRAIKPPRVTCGIQGGNDSAQGCPAVYAGAFEANDGACRRAVVFAHATTRPQTFSWKGYGRVRECTLPPRGIAFEQLDKLSVEAN